MNERCPFPKRYWVYLIVVLICSVLLIANIYRTDGWTGDKQFSEFTESEWQLFFTFIIEEIIIAGVLFLFAFLASAICKKTHLKIAEQWETDKFLGIKTDDYDFVWFDFACSERALILRQGNIFKLYVQEYIQCTGTWEYCGGVSSYDSLGAVKKALFYEYDFYCEENAELDKYGDEIYKEN